MLRIENLSVYTKDKRKILENINLKVKRGELRVVMGPNGSGKTTLLKTIAGLGDYKVFGKIYSEGKDITNLKPYERVKLGIAYLYQDPPKIEIKSKILIERICKKFKNNPNDLIEELNVQYLLERNLFHNFSGGEIKRFELLLTLLTNPKVLLIDEIDSGVDIDSLRIIGNILNELNKEGKTLILVTHTAQITKYLEKLDKVTVLLNGKVVYDGRPDIIEEIIKHGYKIFKNELER